MKTRKELLCSIQAYRTRFQDEEKVISQFLDLLQSPRCFYRDHMPGHITGSAWIVDEAKTHTLLIHHAKLDKWLQPGGHADGDENVLQVAIREMKEETGLINSNLLTEGIFDLDIHPIPARKDFPEHLHYDVRFAFVVSSEAELKISDESHDMKWILVQEVPIITEQNASILRMIRKTLGSN